jgi:hypothetical protein
MCPWIFLGTSENGFYLSSQRRFGPSTNATGRHALMMDIESQAKDTTSSTESNAPWNKASALPSSGVSEKDVDRSTLHDASIDNYRSKGLDEKIEEPAGLQAAGPTVCPVGQVGGDDFVEGGFEGWKVILGCALVAAPTVGESIVHQYQDHISYCVGWKYVRLSRIH